MATPPFTSFIWPPPLGPGDLIAVAAPASPVARALCEAGVRLLQEQGYQVRWGPEVLEERAWGLDTDRELSRRLMAAFDDPEVKAVIGARGGYGSLKLLPHLDLWALQRGPKRVFGFSDLTNVLLNLHQRLGLVTFHGPTVAHLPALTPAARENFFSWLTAPGPQTLRYEGLAVLHPGRAEGPLAGGNLTSLCHLVGTPFAPRLEGYLVFLEDHNEALYRLDRMVHHLLLAGVLEGVKGVVLGAFTGGDSEVSRILEVLGLALEPLGVPVLAALPVGHQPDNYTLPLGGLARLDAAAASLTLL